MQTSPTGIWGGGFEIELVALDFGLPFETVRIWRRMSYRLPSNVGGTVRPSALAVLRFSSRRPTR